MEKYGIQPIFITDESYPRRLKSCIDAPPMLYFRGKADLNSSRIVSIVGSRNATEYGREICRNLIAALKVFDPIVVSGLAYGIDAAAHKESLRNGVPTVGVMAHGLDRIYPSPHRSIAQRMLEEGGLLTEFPSETKPDRENFPKRNRIIAGISDITIVVEANIKGGALITAELANSYNRDVFAYPGRITDEYSSGCNYLIKTHRAHLINRVEDLEYIVGWVQTRASEVKQQLSLLLNLSEEEKLIADLLSQRGNIPIDELGYLTGFQQSKLAVTILGMEMKGLIVLLPGKMLKLC